VSRSTGSSRATSLTRHAGGSDLAFRGTGSIAEYTTKGFSERVSLLPDRYTGEHRLCRTHISSRLDPQRPTTFSGKVYGDLTHRLLFDLHPALPYVMRWSAQCGDDPAIVEPEQKLLSLKPPNMLPPSTMLVRTPVAFPASQIRFGRDFVLRTRMVDIAPWSDEPGATGETRRTWNIGFIFRRCPGTRACD
jgi:hypothetical protein